MAKRDEEREKRLAAALRENLKRRKTQAREEADRGASQLPPPEGEGRGGGSPRPRPPKTV